MTGVGGPRMQISRPGLILAPAKTNLRLDVLGRRTDGFHELRSLVVAAGLFDELRIQVSDQPVIEVACSDPAIPGDDRNLVTQAARRLADRLNRPVGARIELTKAVPVGGGMGGGSSDAAAALIGLNESWQAGLSDDELARLGAEIGSDVPLFFAMPSAVIEGRGELVRPVEMAWAGWALLVLGDEPVSTAEVYRAWRPDETRAKDANAINRLIDADRAEAVAGLCSNDLQAAVFRVAPPVEHMHRRVEQKLGRRVCVSGAGSTLVALFDEQSGAAWAAEELTAEGMRCVVAGVGRNATTTT